MLRILLVLIFAGIASVCAQETPQPVEATTAGGDKVVLHPNGRWEYVDGAKAAAARKTADTFPENHARPAGAQGGWLGFGRTIVPGDKDYNRGTLNPARR